MLKETCLIKSTIAIWMEIGGCKKEINHQNNYENNLNINTQNIQAIPRNNQQNNQEWLSGFGTMIEDNWISLKKIQTNQIHNILLEKQRKI